MAKAGLAGADTPVDRVRTYVRFLVLASLYRDWCALVWDEAHDDSPGCWLSAVEVDPRHVEQLAPDVADFDVSDDDIGDDVEDRLNEALTALMEREHKRVVAALLKGFGGVEGLFVALWRSNKHPQDEQPLDDEDEDYRPPETDADILNDATDEKLAGYQWIREGCPSRGPIRCRADFD